MPKTSVAKLRRESAFGNITLSSLELGRQMSAEWSLWLHNHPIGCNKAIYSVTFECFILKLFLHRFIFSLRVYAYDKSFTDPLSMRNTIPNFFWGLSWIVYRTDMARLFNTAFIYGKKNISKKFNDRKIYSIWTDHCRKIIRISFSIIDV